MPPEGVQRAVIATAEAAFRAAHSGFEVVSSLYFGHFAELGLTELVVRGSEPSSSGGSSAASGGIIGGLRTSLQEELDAASASANAGGGVMTPRQELDALDAQCMMAILDGSAKAIRREEAAAKTRQAHAQAQAVDDDAMVALATVSLFVSREGALLTPAPTTGGAGDHDDDDDDVSGLPRSNNRLLDALRATLRTSFSSLRQLGLREDSLWLDYARPTSQHRGNLLLIDACRLQLQLQRSQQEQEQEPVLHLDLNLDSGSGGKTWERSIVEQVRSLLATALSVKQRLGAEAEAAGGVRPYDPRPFVPRLVASSAIAAPGPGGRDDPFSLSTLATGGPLPASRPALPAAAGTSSSAAPPFSFPSETRPVLLRVTQRAPLMGLSLGLGAAASEPAGDKALGSATILVPLLDLVRASRALSSSSSISISTPGLLGEVEHDFRDLQVRCRVRFYSLPFEAVDEHEARAEVVMHLGVTLQVTRDAAGPRDTSSDDEGHAAAELKLELTRTRVYSYDGGATSAFAAGVGAFPSGQGSNALKVACLARIPHGPVSSSSSLGDAIVELLPVPHF